MNTKIFIVVTALTALTTDEIMLKLPHCHKYDGMFSVVFPHSKLLTREVVQILNQVSLLKCLQTCLMHPQCHSINYQRNSLLCELLDQTHTSTTNKRELEKNHKNWYHYTTEDRSKVKKLKYKR